MTRFRTTYTFSSHEAADCFRYWLKRNQNDADYGSPRFIDLRQVDRSGWCVEYEGTYITRGVATGIEQMGMLSTTK
jgi:hypothetical protein